jgi:rhomboid protease GluP
VKVNLTMLASVAAMWAWSGQTQAITGMSGWGLAVIVVVACCAVVKLVDLVLSMKKGLAIVVIAFAGANAVTILLCGLALASSCSPRWPTGSVPLDNFLVIVCPNPVLVSGLAAIGAAALTLWLCAKEIWRGIEDVGFVATSLRAERSRRHGL